MTDETRPTLDENADRQRAQSEATVVQSDIDSEVNRILAGNGLPPEYADDLLNYANSEYARNDDFRDAWDRRQSDPKVWETHAKRLGHTARQKFDTVRNAYVPPEPLPSEKPYAERRGWSDSQFENYKRTLQFESEERETAQRKAAMAAQKGQ